MPLWKCGGCSAVNAAKRTACRQCGKVPPSEAERIVFSTVVLPAILVERTSVKADLDAMIAEEKRLRAILKRERKSALSGRPI